ncbi:MAG TPA: hypothetical protein VJV03_01955 [Pyrinomonadaceae bacterium]|nr:hypothetical protein [Pyrinomonadaceae bacterium]
MQQFPASTDPQFLPTDFLTIQDLLSKKGALVVAHPGHELCVHHWLTLAKPVVFVLTDGSGRHGQPRLTSTTRIISEVGGRSGTWFGKHTDQTIYRALLDHDFALFQMLAMELAEALLAADVDYVLGDSLEGYNPTHDVCRLLINTAVELANSECGRQRIRNFDFPIIGARQADAIALPLDELSFRRKTEVMRDYPELRDEINFGLDGATLQKLEGFGELGREVVALLNSRGGADFFREELLRPVMSNLNEPAMPAKPYYERYAEILVGAGHYQQVIRYQDHVAPVAAALSDLTASADFADYTYLKRSKTTGR